MQRTTSEPIEVVRYSLVMVDDALESQLSMNRLDRPQAGVLKIRFMSIGRTNAERLGPLRDFFIKLNADGISYFVSSSKMAIGSLIFYEISFEKTVRETPIASRGMRFKEESVKD